MRSIKNYSIKEKVKNITKHCAIGFFSTIVAGGFLFIGEKIPSMLFGIEEDFYLKYFYSIVNPQDIDERNFDSTLVNSIAIVDIKKYRSRSDQSIILDKIYDCNPLVIGVDVFYDEDSDINDSINGVLKRTIDKIKDKTVFICAYKSESDTSIKTIYPFFYSSFKKEELIMASPLLTGFFDYYQCNDSSIPHNDSSPSLPKICDVVVEHSGIERERYSRSFFVNYSKKNLRQSIIPDSSQIMKETIEDKIVLVGDLSEMKDLYNLPFRFGKQEYISGVEDIAYRIISLIRTNPEIKRNRGFVEWDLSKSILLSILLAMAFSIFQERYTCIKKRAKDSNLIKGMFLIIFQPILFLVTEGFIVALCYYYTYRTNHIPYLFLGMIAIALVGWSSELTKYFFKIAKMS